MTGFNLHHIGFAVRDIEAACAYYVKIYGYDICTPVIHDATQTALVQFLRLRSDQTFLELVAPDGPGSALATAVAKGGGLNHLCFLTDDIDRSFIQLQEEGLIALCAPVAGSAFGGRRIAWVLDRSRMPVELLERGASGGL
jgi:methylmalonyl-CoA/ethylmalonyl-CoA epimerase